ncbi:MAG: YwaF family protein [Clostridia bacterium]|nr:YwaF family protein [Clostridia bacterium]
MIYVICLGTTVLLFCLYLMFRGFIEKHLSLILRILAVAVFLVFYVRYYASSGSLLNGVEKLSKNNPFEGQDLPLSAGAVCGIVTVDVWLEIASVLVVVIYPFFPRQKAFANFAKTFTLIFSVLNMIVLPWSAYSFTGSYELSVCSVSMGVEAGLVFCMSLSALYRGGGFKVSKKEFGEMMFVLPMVLLFTMMPYMCQTLFGNFGYMRTENFKLFHRCYLYCAVGFVIFMYFYFRGRDAEFTRMVLLYVALAAMVTYSYKYDYTSIYTITKWPLHLCNTAMFIIPVCLIFKWDWLFYFTLFINVIGVVFAILLPNYGIDLGVFSTATVAYWQNHIIAMGLPLTMVLTGIYSRPKLRHYLYSLIGFVVYFILVLFVNAYYGTDFFFTNGDEITSWLGDFGERVREYTVSFTMGERTLTFYPVYQSLFLVIYPVFALVMWFVYVYVFRLQDMYRREEGRHRKIRAEELALCRGLGEKSVSECRNAETVGKISVKDLYKRYDGADVYAAEDVAFEVGAGEILGFLGPNGAGKSTVIKCMVGIHPMTRGRVEIDGYDMLLQETEAKSKIGFVPDHYALHEKLTGREYINYVADMYGVSIEERDERLSALSGKLGMRDAMDSRIETYSHGMKQKMAIMAALIYEPKVLILDEPLTGLDPTSVYQAKECMRDHARKGNIVFFSSHLVDVVEKLCTRIIIIGNGKILAEADTEELMEKGENLEEYYLETTAAARRAPREKIKDSDEKVELDFLFRKKTGGKAV